MRIQRYMVNFDSADIKKEYYDVLIVGSGIAGVYTALKINPEHNVAILSKETLEISNSVLAQGGIAVSLDKEDSPELHFKDTIYAGAGLCDEEAVWVLVKEAAGNIEHLFEYGVNFDRKNSQEYSLTREGAHSKNRIIHAGDSTGKEVLDKLISIVKTRTNVKIKERTTAIDLITVDGECRGVLAFDEDIKEYRIYISNVVICATGGYGQIYSNTTNPEVATGDGICMAYRAGVDLMDLEFIQFHPTVLFHPENKHFLISEAVRGEGALLKNKEGKRFMPEYHELAELAPRDVVSRAIFEEMKKTDSGHVFLDITLMDRDYLENRFPTIFKTCLGYGIDISKDCIPVAPAEHYCMGGIRSDVFGRTNLKGFYAAGEAACNGIHGANRLASNSLLEGLVFGNKIAGEIKHLLDGGNNRKEISLLFYSQRRMNYGFSLSEIKKSVQQVMTDKVGIIRNEQSLKEAEQYIDEYYNKIFDINNNTTESCELQNLVLLSKLVVESALKRKESRGAHFRVDYPYTDDRNWKRNIIVNKRG